MYVRVLKLPGTLKKNNIASDPCSNTSKQHVKNGPNKARNYDLWPSYHSAAPIHAIY